MIPSHTWFPQSLQARAAWFLNFNTQFAMVAASLGLTSEVSQVTKDNDVMQFSAESDVQVDAFDDAMRQFRRIITTGDIGDPEPSILASPSFTTPDPVPTGIFERLSKLRDRIMAAVNYTGGTGALLGILPSAPPSISPGDVKPTITVAEAQTGYLFSVTVANRAESDMWEVWILKKAGTWTNPKTASGKSVDVTIMATTPGDAEQIQVRVQLRKNNQNYGQPSDVVYATVNP